MLHLSCGFYSSANTSLPTDDLSIHHLARCQRSPPGPTPHPSSTAPLLTFDAPLGARGLAPAVAALPPAHIDPAGTANKDQCPAGQPRSPSRAGRRGGRWAGETEGGKDETSRLNSTPPSCTGPAAHSRHGGSWPRARPHVPRMLGPSAGERAPGQGRQRRGAPGTQDSPPPSPPPEGATAAARGCRRRPGLRWRSGGRAGREGPYPGSGGSWCFWRRGSAALLLPWGPGGALSRGLKRAGLAKEEEEA